MKRVLPSMVAALAMLCCAPISAFAVFAVPGTSDPWLAGMPDGSTAAGGDVAPGQSPVLVPGLTLPSAGFLTFSALGLVTNGPCCSLVGPDGAGLTSHSGGAENGIGDATVPINALVGVFLTASQPSLSAAPGPLDFSGGGLGVSFASLAPALKQVFFIGDGLTGTGSGAVQQFFIPGGATRLYLGTMDGFEWNNNSGSFEVAVTQVPEPSTYALLLAGFGMLGFIARRRMRG